MTRSASLVGASNPEDPNSLDFKLQDDQQFEVIQDMAIHDVVIDGKATVDWAELNLELTHREKEIISVYRKSITGTFQIRSVDSNQAKVKLKDIISGEEFIIVDISMSTCLPLLDQFIFTRILNFGQQKISSGMVFPFDQRYEKAIYKTHNLPYELSSSCTEKEYDVVKMYLLQKQIKAMEERNEGLETL